MKRYTILILVSMFSFMGAFAQEFKGQIEVTEAKAEKVDNDVVVSFNVNIGKFPADYKVTLTPVLYNPDQDYVALPAITLVGKDMNMTDRRTGNVEGERYIIDSKTKTVRYEKRLKFENWMKVASVVVFRQVEGCCTDIQDEKILAVDRQLLYYSVIPHFSDKPLRYELTELEAYDLENPFLHPMEDYNKRYDILLKDRNKGTSVVIFKVGSDVIDMGFRGNQETLDAIAKAFELIESDPNAILKHIMIAGYASPEGRLSYNTALAQRRAESVKRFIQSKLSSPSEELFELYNGREDWGGLREKVENSNMAEKNEILHIIDSYTMEQEERKVKLRQLKGGQPYKYMLENFYPDLRSAGYVQVYYEIDRKATVATAVTDEFGRTTWVDPDSPRNRCVTAINKATKLMVEHQFTEALKLLLEYKDDPRSFNNIGVCYMMLKQYQPALEYFNKAKENGDPYADLNIEQIQWASQLQK